MMNRRKRNLWALFLFLGLGLVLTGCPPDSSLKEREFFSPHDMHPFEFEAEPELEAPDRLLFLDVEVGELNVQQAEIRNIGRVGLLLNDFVIEGPFELDFPEYLDSPPSRLSPGEALIIEVSYTAVDEDPREGMLTIFSNDPDRPEHEIALLANVELPCLTINPAERLRFGSLLSGEVATRPITLTNCSDTSAVHVHIEDFVSDSGFRLGDADDRAGQVRTLAPGTTQLVPVEFRPQEIREFLGELTFISNDLLEPEVTVELTGTGSPPACPEAVIVGTSMDDQAIAAPFGNLEGNPLETVSFNGAQSVAHGGGSIVEYEWSLVSRPADTIVQMSHSQSLPNNELYLELSGTYEVELHVVDNEGTRSCEPARMTVEAISGDAIHLQLVWDTPNDPSRTNNSGADMDLHFLHPNGDWNTSPWDCHWLNMNPNWGNPNNSDMNPRLDIDKITGWGPENINLLVPEPGVTYSVGVYYFSDHGYGPSYATVRIFIHGQLQLELKRRYMTNHQFWHVADISWPSQVITIQDSIMSGFP